MNQHERAPRGTVTQGLGMLAAVLFFALVAVVAGGVLYLIVGETAAIVLGLFTVASIAIIRARQT